jgi:hypothetical protein
MEIWKPMVGYEGLYEVSNDGHARSVSREIVDSVGRRRTLKGKAVSFTINPRGYLTFHATKNGNRRTAFIHVEVAKAFIEKPISDERLDVNHKDHNKLNCSIENLEWLTHGDNVRDLSIYRARTSNTLTRFTRVNDKIVKLPDKTCVDCGKTVEFTSTRCPSCAASASMTFTNNVGVIPKNMLVSVLRENNGNFVKAAAEFGITDNSLRKWCKKYNLPFHSSDYKKAS